MRLITRLLCLHPSDCSCRPACHAEVAKVGGDVHASHTEAAIGRTAQKRSVAVSVCNPDRSPFVSMADTQPQLHPALLRLSAIISQSVTGQGCPTDCSEPFVASICSVQTERSPSVGQQ